MDDEQRREYENLATRIRIETLKQIDEYGMGHVGGSMSIADVLAVLYGGIMNIDPKNPRKTDRDQLALSKGHSGPALYSALALKGFFGIDWLKTLNRPRTLLPSHVDRNKTPGVDVTAGSLGQGLSVAVGIALGNRHLGINSYTYAIIGDGESQEGQIWEAISVAAQYKLDHLILFIDNNKDQIDGFTADVNNMEDYVEKFEAFRWDAVRVDGHDVGQIEEAILIAKEAPGKPHAIVLDTVKGKGCPFCEGKRGNHHMHLKPGQAQETIVLLEKSLSA
jgi:transketolase